MITIAIEARCECPSCASHVFIPGLVAQTTCSSCQAPVDLRPHLAFVGNKAFWDSIVRDLAFESTEPAGRLKATTVVPTCPGCSKPLPLPQPLAAGDVACASCAEATTLRAAPGDVPHFITHLLGEDPEVLPGTKEGEAAQPGSATAQPVRFPCPACDASLSVDGSSRTIECTYCHTSAYLPDDLWRRLHPVRTKQRWYLCVDEARFERYRRSVVASRRFGLAWGACALVAFGAMFVGMAWEGAPWWQRWAVTILAGAAGLTCIVLSVVNDSRTEAELRKRPS